MLLRDILVAEPLVPIGGLELRSVCSETFCPEQLRRAFSSGQLSHRMAVFAEIHQGFLATDFSTRLRCVIGVKKKKTKRIETYYEMVKYFVIHTRKHMDGFTGDGKN